MILLFVVLLYSGLSIEEILKKTIDNYDSSNINNIVPKDSPQYKPEAGSGKGSKTEDKVRKVFEDLYRQPFPTINRDKKTWFVLKWLFNDLTNQPLELDGYNDKLKIAFEVQGPQHYEYSVYHHPKGIEQFAMQAYCDDRKTKLCFENGVWLVIVPYYIVDRGDKVLREYILDRLPGGKLVVMEK